MQAHQAMLGVARGNAAGGAVEERIALVPDAPAQRCAIARAVQGGRGMANYGCATGVGGQVLRVRVTAPVSSVNPAEILLLDGLVVRLLQGVTRSVADLPPLPAPAPVPTGNGFSFTLPHFERAAAPQRL
jgi:hypothetical protein